MSIFQDYEKKRTELLKKMQTMKEFEMSDEIVGYVFEIGRQICSDERRASNPEWLVQKGLKLATYAGILSMKHIEVWGEYKTAEMAFKSVRDALMLASKSEHKNITSAKAFANKATQEAEIDALAREQRSDNYKSAAKVASDLVTFFQTTVGWRKHEMSSVGIQDRGNTVDRSS